MGMDSHFFLARCVRTWHEDTMTGFAWVGGVRVGFEFGWVGGEGGWEKGIVPS
jgi:hypothetical protein